LDLPSNIKNLLLNLAHYPHPFIFPTSNNSKKPREIHTPPASPEPCLRELLSPPHFFSFGHTSAETIVQVRETIATDVATQGPEEVMLYAGGSLADERY